MIYAKQIKSMLFLLILVFIIPELKSQELKVGNVRFEQQQKNIVIYYDLQGKPGKEYKITLTASENYGTTFDIKPETVTGDIGENITPGSGKKIIWYVNEDFPNGIKGDGYAFAVHAELHLTKEELKNHLSRGALVGIIFLALIKLLTETN